jgi:acyl-CoA thioesterase FadM
MAGLLGRLGFTTSMELRYVRPLRIGQEVVARGSIASNAHSVVRVKVTLEQAGRIGMRARVAYSLPSVEQAERTLEQPLPEAWRRYFVAGS